MATPQTIYRVTINGTDTNNISHSNVYIVYTKTTTRDAIAAAFGADTLTQITDIQCETITAPLL